MIDMKEIAYIVICIAVTSNLRKCKLFYDLSFSERSRLLLHGSTKAFSKIDPISFFCNRIENCDLCLALVFHRAIYLLL